MWSSWNKWQKSMLSGKKSSITGKGSKETIPTKQNDVQNTSFQRLCHKSRTLKRRPLKSQNESFYDVFFWRVLHVRYLDVHRTFVQGWKLVQMWPLWIFSASFMVSSRHNYFDYCCQMILVRINRGLDVDICLIWSVTIVVISVCFSWALGPLSFYFNFSLAAVTVCLCNTIVVAEKA